jgi:hypothetical protein
MNPEPIIETNCTIEHEGRSYSAAGASLCPCPDSYWRGVVYVKPPAAVTDWHGNRIASALFGREYRGNFCTMRAVTFDWNGIRFHGRYCPDRSQAVGVRSTKRQNVSAYTFTDPAR